MVRWFVAFRHSTQIATKRMQTKGLNMYVYNNFLSVPLRLRMHSKQKSTIMCQLDFSPVCLRAFRFTSPVSLCLCACVVLTTYDFSRCHLLLIQHVSLSLTLSLPHTEYVSLSGLKSFNFLPIYHLILGPYTVLFPVNPV